jgi:hypothetical protein
VLVWTFMAMVFVLRMIRSVRENRANGSNLPTVVTCLPLAAPWRPLGGPLPSSR